MRRVTVLLWLVLALVVGVHWVGEAQQPPAGADDPRFTGKSVAMEGKDLTVARRHFEPGARSAWHSHDKGQLLMVEEGRMRTQKRGQTVKELGVGESDYTGTEHGPLARCGEVAGARANQRRLRRRDEVDGEGDGRGVRPGLVAGC